MSRARSMGKKRAQKSSQKDRIEKKGDPWVTRHTYRVIAKPCGIFLAKLGVTPNQVSFLSIVAAAIAGYFFSQGAWEGFAWGYLFFQLTLLLDHIDGCVARYTNTKSVLGRFVDEVSNKLHRFFLIVGVSSGAFVQSGNEHHLVLGIVAVFLWFFAAYVSYVKATIFSFKEDITLLKEDKRGLGISFNLLVMNVFGLLVLINQPVLALWFITLISLNAFQQIYSVRKQWFRENKK